MDRSDAAPLALDNIECQSGPQDPEGIVPTYQYACTACGDHLEAVQSFTDEPLTECPACEGRLRKVFNSVGVVFKGSGFYRTDSRANGSESSNKSGSKPESSDASSSTTKTDSGSSNGGSSNGASSSSGSAPKQNSTPSAGSPASASSAK